MIRYLIFLIICSFVIPSEISNIQVSQRQDGSGIVDICYDLIEDEGIYPSFEVGLQISFDGGQTFASVDSSSLSGNAGANVIPGFGLCMQYQSQLEIYSNQTQVKITASSSFVSSQLPFSMVNIQTNADNLNLDYEGEFINYDYEMMQFELTNIDLVTWLETYTFDLTDAQPIYSCSEFSNLYNDDPEQGEGGILGCIDENALNYNPNATINDESNCIFSDQGACLDVNAVNYNEFEEDPLDSFDDCSCYYASFSIQENQGCGWFETLPEGGLGQWFFDNITDQLLNEYAGSELPSSFKIILNQCNDEASINYPLEIIDNLNDLINDSGGYLSSDCFEFSSTASSICLEDCLYDYSHLIESDDDTLVNINDFQTQHISFQGNSFLIEEGKGNHPVILNSQNCVDAAVAKLFMDYYGLRIPTAGEWMKAAREDDQSCWPWTDATCTSMAGDYCQGIYSISSEEQLEVCQSNSAGVCFDNCQNSMFLCEGSCSDNYYSCLNTSSDPDCSGGPNGEPSDYPNCECENQLWGCDNACVAQETECMLGCQDLPDENQCYETFSAYLTCLGNGDTLSCEEIEIGDSSEQAGLLWYLSETSESYYGNLTLDEDNAIEFFNQFIFYDRFHLADCGGDCSFNPLNIVSVGQFPMGQSWLGLYDMIGNAPEVVLYNSNSSSGLYTLSHMPGEDPFRSFCATDGVSYSDDNHSAASLMSVNNGQYFPFYGLRLARTLAQ